MKRIFRILAITIFAVAVPIIMQAQINLRHPNDGFAPNTGGQTNSPVGAPIDGGMGVLLALAIAYAVKKVPGVRKTEQ